jgi:hypothetical protein
MTTRYGGPETLSVKRSGPTHETRAYDLTFKEIGVVIMTRPRNLIIAATVVIATASALGIASAIGDSGTRDPTVVSGDFADLTDHVSAINHERRKTDALPSAAEHKLAALSNDMKSKFAPRRIPECAKSIRRGGRRARGRRSDDSGLRAGHE